MKHVTLAALFVVMGMGCAMGVEPTQDDGISTDQAAAAGGCSVECPKCKPGDICPMMACIQICPDKGKAECQADTDCTATADYCKGCDCVALAPKEDLPHCSGPGVKCFADPCMTWAGACISGKCALVAKP
jgi:hypothetical protein